MSVCSRQMWGMCVAIATTMLACGNSDEAGGDDPDTGSGVLPDGGTGGTDGGDGGDDGDDDADTNGGPDSDSGTPDSSDTDVVLPDSGGLDCEERPVCADDSDCAGGAVCAGSECVQPTAPADVPVTGSLLIVTSVRLGPPGTAVAIDVDGDGEPDNALGEALVAYPRGQEVVERELNNVIATGFVGFVAEVVDEPQFCGAVAGTTSARIIVHDATTDIDADGLIDPVEVGEVREVVFANDSFNDLLGPRCQLRDGSLDADTGTVTAAGGDGCELFFPLPSGQMLMLPVDRLIVQAPAPAREGEKDGELVTLIVAGVVSLQSVVDETNRLSPLCACAGINTSRPLATLTEEGGFVSASCLQTPDVSGCSDQADGQECSNLENLCLSLTLASAASDISSEEGGPVDSLSFGFEAQAEPVQVATPPVMPDLLARGDHWSVSRNLDIEPGVTSLLVGVLVNDELRPDDGDSLLDLQWEGDPELDAEIDGDFVRVTVPPEFDFTDAGSREVVFSYTIGDDANVDRRSTADVTLRLNNTTPTPDARPDRFSVASAAGAPVELNVMANDETAPWAFMYIASFDTPTGGTLAFGEGQRSLIYTPQEAGYHTFSYELRGWSEFGGDSTATSTAQVELDVYCAPGHFGAACQPCGTCAEGFVCDEGPLGTGACACVAGSVADGAECYEFNECENYPGLCGDTSCLVPVGEALYICECEGGETFNAQTRLCEPAGGCARSTGVCAADEVCVDWGTGDDEYECVPAGSWQTVHTYYPSGFSAFTAPRVSLGAGRLMASGFGETVSSLNMWARRNGLGDWTTQMDTTSEYVGPRFAPAGEVFGALRTGRTRQLVVGRLEDTGPVELEADGSSLPTEGSLFSSGLVLTDDTVLLGSPSYSADGARPGVRSWPLSPTGFGVLSLISVPTDLQTYSFGTGSDAAGDGLVVFSDPYTDNAGAAWVLQRDLDGAWSSTELSPSSSGSGAGFGLEVRVSADGQTLVLSSPFGSSGRCAGTCGWVDVFNWDGSAWVPTQLIPSPAPVTMQNFGTLVGMDGDHLVVARYDRDFSDNTSTYVLDVYQRGTRAGRWVRSSVIAVGNSNDLRLDLRARTLAVSSPYALTVYEWIAGPRRETSPLTLD